MSRRAGSARAGALAVAAKLGGAGLGILVNVILARLMGAEDFGRYALGIALGTVIAVLGSGGMPFGAVRYVPDYLARGDFGALRGFTRASLAVTLLGGAACAVAMMLGAQMIDPGHVMAGVLPWAALIVLPAALAQSLSSLLQARGHVAGPEIVQSLVRQGATLGLIMAWVGVGAALNFRVALGVSAIAVALACAMLAHRLAGLTRPEPRMPAAFDGFKLWMGAGAGILVILVTAAFNERIDLFILGWMVTPADLGIYSAAVRVASISILALAGLGAAYTPRIAAAWAKDDCIEVERLCREGALAGTALMLAMTLGAWLLGGFVLSLFGPEFRAGATVLTILLGAQIAVGMMGIAGGLTIISGNNHIALTGVAVGLVVNAITAITLVPSMGISGAAIGVFAGFLVSHGVIGIWCSLRLGLRATLLPIGPRALSMGVRHV
ncbi:oligosaccharide flippase family protein [Rhodobacteraceae bacterium KMM 6894]|nr:oligosaccharide flippase family protein [Rhodobacteraceae bacterium KMM 6894]